MPEGTFTLKTAPHFCAKCEAPLKVFRKTYDFDPQTGGPVRDMVFYSCSKDQKHPSYFIWVASTDSEH